MKIRSRTTGKDVEVKPGPGRSVNSALAKLANLGEAKLLGFDKMTKVKK